MYDFNIYTYIYIYNTYIYIYIYIIQNEYISVNLKNVKFLTHIC